MKKTLLFAALAFSVNSYAQKFTGKLALQKGQKLEVVTESKRNATQEAMGQTMESTASTKMIQVYDVQDAGASTVIEHKVKQFVLNSEAMGQTMNFDSEKAEDRKSEIGEVIDKKLLKNKYTMTVDGNGKIVTVKVDDDNPNGKKKSDDEGMAGMMAQQLGIAGGLPTIGEQWTLYILPAKEVGQGDTWADSTSKDGTSIKHTYSVSGMTADEVTLDWATVSKIEKVQNMMGVDATIAINEKSFGTATVDRKTGIVKAINGQSRTEGTVEAQGMTIPVTGSGTMSVTVTAK